MKNFKNIIYLLVLSFMMVSCGEDEIDSVTNFGTVTVPEEIKASFMDDNLSASLFEGESTTYRMGITQIIDGKVEVMLDVTSTDGEVEATYPNPIVIERGQSVVLFDVMPTDDGVVESGETYTFTISEIKVTFVDGTVKYYTFSGDDTRTLAVKDVPTPIVTTVGDLDFNFTWSGSGNDLDCRIRNSANANIDTGYSTSPGEMVTLPASAPDGDYTFSLRPWTVVDASIDYSIEVVAPTETRTYSGVFTDLVGGWSMEPIVLEINKSTNGTEVTYNITQL